MKNTGSRLDHVISTLLESTLQVTADQYIKKLHGEEPERYGPERGSFSGCRIGGSCNSSLLSGFREAMIILAPV